MSKLFNEIKTPEIVKEISTGEFETIYNINIWSRYDEDRELCEMLQFCKFINNIELASYIDELFYDSKASLCFIKSIELDKDAKAGTELEAIRTIALLTISQFQFQGVIGHQNPYLSRKIQVMI
ncbi:hypothetical protein EC844_12631 [Acinetobacter calcoaceticus]|uniref:Uncharacterized protein n=1 Tax=Acinetobacter calcoaceticus TaxID=471 RepID=A0A4R1XDI8_ACICA|nr:hypothetical protein EC844_12631 [Acinetobacter calcoaceticus]